MIEKIDNCPLCGYTDFKKDLICKDHLVSKELFTIVKCKKCNFSFTNPRPVQKNIAKYYQSFRYISHQDSKKGLLSKAYYLIRQKTLREKIQLINKNSTTNKRRILDIGCGTGEFIKICAENGWQVQGIEIDAEARNTAIRKTKAKIDESVFRISNEEKFTMISLWHVLEHVHELDKTLTKISSLLSTEGKLIIAVPNNNSYDAKKYKEFWAAYDVPRHLYHFTKETLILLLSKYAMKLIDIYPMKYDAYYISLLSYKYQYNKFNYVKSAWDGFISNKMASKNDNNYSSLTYIFSK